MQKVNQDPMKTNLDSETNQHFFCGFHTNVNEIKGREGWGLKKFEMFSFSKCSHYNFPYNTHTTKFRSHWPITKRLRNSTSDKILNKLFFRDAWSVFKAT